MTQTALEALRQALIAILREELAKDDAHTSNIWHELKKEITTTVAAEALNHTNDNQSAAAYSLGINRNTIREWTKQS